MSSAFHVSRLAFSEPFAKQLFSERTRKGMLTAVLILLVYTAVAYVLYWRFGIVFMFVFLPVFLLVGTVLMIYGTWPIQFVMTGNASAIYTYLDEMMSQAREYERSTGVESEVTYRFHAKGWHAESGSYCVLSVHGDSVEVRGSRDIVRRLRYWGTRRFACL